MADTAVDAIKETIFSVGSEGFDRGLADQIQKQVDKEMGAKPEWAGTSPVRFTN